MGYGIQEWNPPDEEITYEHVEDIEVISEGLIMPISVKWVNKPLLDCILDLMKLGDCDCFVDNANDFHLFKKNSKNNDDEAIHEEDLLVELTGLVADSVDVRNRIITYGESGELPVIYTSEDLDSQTTYGIRERIITDSSLNDETKAQDYTDAEKNRFKEPVEKGSATCLTFMPKLIPGYMTYVIHTPQDIHARYRVISWTTKVPSEETQVFFSQYTGISNLFKERIQKDMQQEKIVNPHKMKYSYNFNFDDEGKIDTNSSSGYFVSESNLRKDTTVESGIVISNVKSAVSDITQVHILAKGNQLDGATCWIQANSQAQFQEVPLNTLTSITNTGTELKLKIIITSDNTRIDSIAILYK